MMYNKDEQYTLKYITLNGEQKEMDYTPTENMSTPEIILMLQESDKEFYKFLKEESKNMEDEERIKELRHELSLTDPNEDEYYELLDELESLGDYYQSQGELNYDSFDEDEINEDEMEESNMLENTNNRKVLNKTLQEKFIEFPTEEEKDEYIKDNKLKVNIDYKDKGPIAIELLNELKKLKEDDSDVYTKIVNYFKNKGLSDDEIALQILNDTVQMPLIDFALETLSDEEAEEYYNELYGEDYEDMEECRLIELLDINNDNV